MVPYHSVWLCWHWPLLYQQYLALLGGSENLKELTMFFEILLWGGYGAVLIWLTIKGRGHDAASSGRIGFAVQALAYVATYISAVALVGFSGLAYTYGLQMLLVAAGNVWLGTWAVYRFFAWPTRVWQRRLGARTPAQLLGKAFESPVMTRCLAILFAVFLGVYASAVIKGAAILLQEILPFSLATLIWGVAIFIGFSVFIGGLRGVLYTEALQGGIMLVGIVMLFIAVMNAVGGPIKGIIDLAALPATQEANEGFTALSSGEAGLFILSLVCVTSVAVWAQPQMIQRHFSLVSAEYMRRATPIAMLVLTIVVGGTYFSAALSRLILPEIDNMDAVMPMLVRTLLPAAGMQLFVLAIVSAAFSTATALYHIAVSALAEDVFDGKYGRFGWGLSIIVCIIVSASCAQIEGALIALLYTTSWSMVGGTILVAYVMLVLFGVRNFDAAAWSMFGGFFGTLIWYLCMYRPTAITAPIFGDVMTGIPPFFIGFLLSCCAWILGFAYSRIAGTSLIGGLGAVSK